MSFGHDVDLSNAGGQFLSVTDYTQFIDSTGVPLPLPKRVVHEFIANGAIARGNPVSLVAPTATQPMRVGVAAVGVAKGWLVVGVAETAATAAGQKIQVCTGGFTFGFCTGLTPAFGQNAQLSAVTAGLITATAADPAATDVLGQFLGMWLGAKLTVAPNVDLAPLLFWPK